MFYAEQRSASFGDRHHGVEPSVTWMTCLKAWLRHKIRFAKVDLLTKTTALPHVHQRRKRDPSDSGALRDWTVQLAILIGSQSAPVVILPLSDFHYLIQIASLDTGGLAVNAGP